MHSYVITMHFETIKDTAHRLLSFVRQLYEGSFAWYERRSWEQLAGLLKSEEMQLMVVLDNEHENLPFKLTPAKGVLNPLAAHRETAIGLIITWRLASWYYIEHLAVEPSLQGKQYGSRIIQYLSGIAKNRLILETSLPDSPDNERRIRFYERQGFMASPFPYVQPPYRLGEAPVPMVIMSMPVIEEKEEFNAITGLIRQEVYEKNYKS